MKLCMAVGLGKVNVGLVCKEMKTLLELMLAAPVCDKAELANGAEGTEG
jgi:hypothetical protein